MADEISPQDTLTEADRLEIAQVRDALAPAAAVASAPGETSPPDRNVDRRKPAVELSACRRPERFAGLLRALNLTQGCDT